jgi:hypothetical protein
MLPGVDGDRRHMQKGDPGRTYGGCSRAAPGGGCFRPARHGSGGTEMRAGSNHPNGEWVTPATLSIVVFALAAVLLAGSSRFPTAERS